LYIGGPNVQARGGGQPPSAGPGVRSAAGAARESAVDLNRSFAI